MLLSAAFSATVQVFKVCRLLSRMEINRMKPASSALTGTSPKTYPAPPHTAAAPVAANSPVLYSVPFAAASIAPCTFYAAARNGDAAALFAMLASGRFRASAAEPSSGRTALMLAAEQGHATIVAILTRGTLAAYINAEDAQRNTALSLATASGHKAVVDVLRSRGAGWNGPDVGAVPGHTGTALSAPMLMGDPPPPATCTVSTPKPGLTPERRKLTEIFSAIDFDDAAGLRALLSQAGFPGATEPTVLAMTERRILDGTVAEECTPLMAAAWLGRASMVSALIGAGADVDQANRQQVTALMLAAKNGQLATTKALIQAQAYIDQTARNGWTALMLAAYYGRTTTLQALLHAGASVHRTTVDGLPPLTYAAMNGHADNVRTLIGAGARSSLVSMHGHTAMSLAIRGKHAEVIELLRADGALSRTAWQLEKRAS